MAIKVIVVTVGSIPEGSKTDTSVQMHLMSDYESKMPFDYNIYAQVHQVSSQKEAIHQALDQLSVLSDELKEGAREAKEEHPIGS